MGWQDRDYNTGGGGGYGGGFGGGGPTGGEFLTRLQQFFNQSFYLFSFRGVRVDIHILFVLFIVLECVTSAGSILWSLRWLSLLFASVLLHEFGHVFGCRSVGGSADRILLWPLGGLAFCAPPHRPWAEFVTVVWGPLVNVIIAAGCFAALLLTLPADFPMPVSLNPFNMWGAGYVSGWRGLLADLYVVNYALLLFNICLIFYPFDGGRLVQVAIWAKYGYGRSMHIATRLGMAGAVVVALVGFAKQEFLLFIIALFGFMTCYRQLQMIKAMGVESVAYDVGYYNARARENRKPGLFARWQNARAQRQRDADQQRERKREAEIDRILAKVKNEGMHSLTEREKKALQDETARKNQ